MENNKQLQKEIVDGIKTFDLMKLKDIYDEQKNFDWNFTDNKGNNLLHFLLKKYENIPITMIQFLLECNVDSLAVNESFETPYEIAKNNNSMMIVALFNRKIYEIKKEYENFLITQN